MDQKQFVKLSMFDTAKVVVRSVENGLNVLLIGDPGCGKTALALDTCEKLKKKCDYKSMPTLDPWSDLVGIPKESKENPGYLEYIRPKSTDDVEVMILDELNAVSHYKVINAIKELLHFRSINGRKYKNLGSIIGAMNMPDSQFGLMELDEPTIARFQVKIIVNSNPEPWQLEKVGVIRKAAEQLVEWNKRYNYFYKARDLFNLYQLKNAGIPLSAFGGEQTALAELESQLKGQTVIYDKYDFRNGRIIKDLTEDTAKYSAAVHECLDKRFERVQIKFYLSTEMKTIYELLTPEVKRLFKRTVQKVMRWRGELPKCNVHFQW